MSFINKHKYDSVVTLYAFFFSSRKQKKTNYFNDSNCCFICCDKNFSISKIRQSALREQTNSHWFNKVSLQSRTKKLLLRKLESLTASSCLVSLRLLNYWFFYSEASTVSLYEYIQPVLCGNLFTPKLTKLITF